MIKLPDGWRRIGADLHCVDGRVMLASNSPHRLTKQQSSPGAAPYMASLGGSAVYAGGATIAKAAASGGPPEGGASDPKAAEAAANAAALAAFARANWWYTGPTK
jgi:hypothetical protein